MLKFVWKHYSDALTFGSLIFFTQYPACMKYVVKKNIVDSMHDKDPYAYEKFLGETEDTRPDVSYTNFEFIEHYHSRYPVPIMVYFEHFKRLLFSRNKTGYEFIWNLGLGEYLENHLHKLDNMVEECPDPKILISWFKELSPIAYKYFKGKCTEIVIQNKFVFTRPKFLHENVCRFLEKLYVLQQTGHIKIEFGFRVSSFIFQLDSSYFTPRYIRAIHRLGILCKSGNLSSIYDLVVNSSCKDIHTMLRYLHHMFFATVDPSLKHKLFDLCNKFELNPKRKTYFMIKWLFYNHQHKPPRHNRIDCAIDPNGEEWLNDVELAIVLPKITEIKLCVISWMQSLS